MSIKLMDAEDKEILNKQVFEQLNDLKNLFLRLPVEAGLKKEFINKSLKAKSAWFACLVNSNIDVLLLPEFLMHGQARNILLKRETDLYLKSVEGFAQLKAKDFKELYELILSGNTAKSGKANDLFSAQDQEKVKCPKAVEQIFKAASKEENKHLSIEQIPEIFLNWFELNDRRFGTQRQMLLWLNYTLFKVMGESAFLLNTEEFLYYHWKQKSDSQIDLLNKLFKFWSDSASKLLVELRQFYQQSIQFHELVPGQKLLVNHLFENSFEIEQEDEMELLNLLQKRGFILPTDIEDLSENEIKSSVETLLNQDYLRAYSDGSIKFYGLNPSYQKTKSRLSIYSNFPVMESKPAFSWDQFISQESQVKVVEPIQRASDLQAAEPVKMSIPEPAEEYREIPVKKKVFFG